VDVYNLCRGFTVAGEYVDTGSGRSEERQISERLGIAYGTARNYVQEVKEG
jgi:transposase